LALHVPTLFLSAGKRIRVATRDNSFLPFGLSTDVEHGVQVLTVSGEIDLMVAAEFADAVNEAVKSTDVHLVIDLARVRYMDSSAFRVLIPAQNAMAAGTKHLGLVVESEHLNRLFAILGLDQFFQIHPSLDDALAAALETRTPGVR
jgi:anti-sigma B factor antagonist